MIKAQRQRGRRRASTVVAGLAAVVAMVLGLASPALAASVAVVGDFVTDNWASVHGTWPDNGDPGSDPQTRDLNAGLLELLIDGEVETEAYCIDINTPISAGADLDEIDWDTSGVANLDKVEAILRWYHPNGDGPDDHPITGSDAAKAAATQAAIWHYTDEFNLTDDPAENPQVVIDNYKAILAAVEAGLEGFGEPTVSLTVTPPASTEAAAGGLVGPYVINTTADSVTLTPSDGVTLHNEDGSAFTGEVVDGTQVWLSSANAGAGTITATATAEVGAGRVFFTQGVQRLVLASTITSDTTAEAPVSFTQAPPTTPTSSTTTTPETTTTTVPITVQSTVPDTPTTTVPITPNQGEGGGLPVTGAQSIVLVVVAAVLLAVGAGFGIVSRRKRLEGEG